MNREYSDTRPEIQQPQAGTPPEREPQAPLPSPSREDLSAWAPLKRPAFRMLWLAWLTANVCMLMHDVAAAWAMTSLAPSPLMVALVQSASTLPVLFLSVPSGALADILDRRRFFVFTQLWVAGVGLFLFVATLAGFLTAPLLLLFTFANGIGFAMRWPLFSAVLTELVPRRELSRAIALNPIAMNASRIFGPIIAGFVLSGMGSAYVFLLNAVMSMAMAAVVLRWRREQKTNTLPKEKFFSAIRVGLQYVRMSPAMHAVLLRVFTLFLCSTALPALLPLVAKGLSGGNAHTFTLLLSTMGVGAVTAASRLARIRERRTRDQCVRDGIMLYSAGACLVAIAPNVYIAALAMFGAGFAWTLSVNALTLSAQIALPDWVRARGMAVYQMAIMGGSTLGSALWGQVASVTSVHTSLLVAAASALAGLLWTGRYRVEGAAAEDLTPAGNRNQTEVAIPVALDQGPVLVTVEYRIDPERYEEFLEKMRESRRSHLRNGALSWNLYRDLADPERYVEQFTDESWVAHLRQHDRLTHNDLLVREQKEALHLGEAPPVVAHLISQNLSD